MFHRFRALKRMSRLLVAAVVSIASIAAQTTSTVTDPDGNATTAEAIAAGDLVQVSVFGHPELSQQVRVGSDGRAQLPLLGEVGLGGVTEADAVALIAGQLRDRNVLLHPRVNVEIKESAGQSVSVIGEVQHPGVYPLASTRTVLDVLSLAGGLTNTADSHIDIKRHSGATDIITLPAKGDGAGDMSSMDALVYPGDSVLVPRAGIVYVLGDVGRPGGFAIQDSGGITLLEVMAEAGGALPTASSHHLMLLRKQNGAYAQTKELDLGKITHGHGEDIRLQANDIVFVPNDRVKSALRTTGNIAAAAAGVSTVAIYGMR